MMDIADMNDEISLGDLLERGAEGGDEMRRQIGYEADCVRQDGLPAGRQADAAHRRIERREEQILGDHGRVGQPVEQRRLAGIGVADQRDHRIGHALARGAMEGARPLGAFELVLELGDALADQPAVDLELALAGTAEEAVAAALTLQMGPGTHETRALIAERSELDLQPPLMSARPRAENLENQAGAVDDLAVPRLLEVALLDRRDRRVDDD